ncbi:MAG: hypothetical protein JXR81_04450 [Candidatus Goldbacteria bacterium]|nr:hypothetical protein [Candidatus Goldiibacteriota bacterium]
MNKLKVKLLSLLIIFILAGAVFAEPYTWKSVQVGGGGFVTGFIFHPLEQNLLYARTDMGGAYRWDNANTKWIPLTDSMTRNNADYMGILAMAVDPSDVNRVYMLCGKYTQSWAGNGAVLASSNKGVSWTINPVPFKVGANEQGRGAGERLAVDPNLGSILFAGTSGSYPSGLYKSTNSGASFAAVASFPQTGVINFIQFIKSSSTTGNATQTIYVAAGTNGSSLYKSTDGGASWALVTGQPSGQQATRASLVGTTMYIVYCSNNGPNAGDNNNTSSVYKLNTVNDSLTDITPVGSTVYGGISADPQNVNNVIVTTLFKWTANDPIYYSTNGGTSWTNISTAATYVRTTSPYTSSVNPHWATDIQIDPNNGNIAIWNTGYGVWRCTNLQSSSVTWNFNDVDLEETVPMQIISPPVGTANLISAMGDYDGFRHTNLDASQNTRHTPNRGTTLSIAFAENSNPLKVVKAYSHYRDSNNIDYYGAYSNDGGTTWTDFPSYPSGASAGGSKAIAISPNGTNIVWSPTGAAVSYSVNNGSSWTTCAGSPPAGFSPVADRVNSAKFYLYDGVTGTLWRSIDSGATFAAGASGLPTVPSWALADGVCAAAPDNEGHVWITTAAGGLYRSTDSGATATKVNSVSEAYRIGFGMAASGYTYPAIYLQGVVGGALGFYRSIDTGATWERINTDANQYGTVHQITGDPRVYGRCYVSAEGRGALYGEPAGSPTSTPTSTYTVTPGGPTFTFTQTPTDTATATPTNAYKLIYDGDTPGYTLADGAIVVNAAGSLTEGAGGVTGNGMIAAYTSPAYWGQAQWDIPGANQQMDGNTDIVFNIKALTGTVSQYLLYLDWTYASITVANYLEEGGAIDTTWKTVRIPIADVLSNTHTAIYYLAFINNADTDYSVIVDNIRFEGASAVSTSTFTNTATQTSTYTSTYTATNTYTQTETEVPATNTFTQTYTLTFTETATATDTSLISTDTFTSTPTDTATHTYTDTATATYTNTETQTLADTPTHTFTYTSTDTNTDTSTPTYTYTFTDTVTPGGPTFTDTPTATQTFTPMPCACAVVYGNTNIAAMVGASIYNSLTAIPVYVSENTIMESMGVHLASSGGGLVKMALYTNDGSAPLNLIVSSGDTPSVSGWNVVDVVDTPLSKGVYWLVINTQSGITVSAMAGMQNAELYTGFFDEASAMPAVFPVSGVDVGNGSYALVINACPGSCDTPTETPTPVLPCMCEDDFGLQYTPTAVTVNISGYVSANVYYMGYNGTLSGIYLHVESGSGYVRLAVYSNDNSTGSNVPYILQAQTEETAVTAGDNLIPLPSAHLNSGIYWIAIQMSPGVLVSRDIGTNGDEMYYEMSYGSFPGFLPWPMGQSAGNWAFKVNYCPDTCNTPTNTFTATYTYTDTQTATFTQTYTETYTATETVTTGGPTFTFTDTPTETFTETATEIFTETPTETTAETATYTNTVPPASTSTYTHTITDTYTHTATHTYTNTATSSHTNTSVPSDTHTQTPSQTPTNTNTHTATISVPTNTFTPTPVPTEAELKVKDQLVYPNPVNPGDNPYIFVKYYATRDYKEVHFRMYSSALRLVDEIAYKNSYTAGTHVIPIPDKHFQGLANGAYYYMILLIDNDGKEARGKVGKIIVLKK